MDSVNIEFKQIKKCDNPNKSWFIQCFASRIFQKLFLWIHHVCLEDTQWSIHAVSEPLSLPYVPVGALILQPSYQASSDRKLGLHHEQLATAAWYAMVRCSPADPGSRRAGRCPTWLYTPLSRGLPIPKPGRTSWRPSRPGYSVCWSAGEWTAAMKALPAGGPTNRPYEASSPPGQDTRWLYCWSLYGCLTSFWWWFASCMQ